MIYFFTVWDSSKDIGAAYNKYMELIKDDDFAVFVDGDAMFTTTYWGKQIENIIKENPNLEYATCKTNRVNCDWMLAGYWNNNDIIYHREIGEELCKNFNTQIEDVTNNQPLMSGIMILIKKSAWKKIGGFKSGALGVDNDFHERAKQKNIKLFLMKGVYLLHYYRGGDRKYKYHLL
jgi:GT2 family glycosyltransferase